MRVCAFHGNREAFDRMVAFGGFKPPAAALAWKSGRVRALLRMAPPSLTPPKYVPHTYTTESLEQDE